MKKKAILSFFMIIFCNCNQYKLCHNIIEDDEMRLASHVKVLATKIGERNLKDEKTNDNLKKAAEYIKEQLKKNTGREPNIYNYTAVYDNAQIRGSYEVENIEVELPGSDASLAFLIIGAHYDTVDGSPGADDNASGVSALIELGRCLKEYIEKHGSNKKTIKLVAFPNEEEPYSLDKSGQERFDENNMGSRQYARMLKKNGEHVDVMISLESIGYYSNTPMSQRLTFLEQYPFLKKKFCLRMVKFFLPYYLPGVRDHTIGNFVVCTGNKDSSIFIEKARKYFKQCGAIAVSDENAERSDNGAFYREGYNGFMITDTADLRNDNYHEAGDTFETIDMKKYTEVFQGLKEMVIAEGF